MLIYRISHTRLFLLFFENPLFDNKVQTAREHSISKDIVANMTGRVIDDVLLRTSPANVENLIGTVSTANVCNFTHQTQFTRTLRCSDIIKNALQVCEEVSDMSAFMYFKIIFTLSP